jgi:acyl dehydratase
MARYFEDFEVGDVYEPDDRYEVTKAEITEFAERYDPQRFHLEGADAEDSLFGSLAASGWHTAAMCMRLLVDGVLDEASMGARGIDELRWNRPVHPGDTLRIEVEVLDKRPSESRPEIGHVRTKLVGYNQHEEAVIEWVALGMFRRRDGGR